VRPDAELIAEVAAGLAKARKPVIVAGQAVANNRARDALVKLAERHRAPVWAAPMASRNVFPEAHALFAGFLAASREAVVNELAGSDYVLVLGAPAFTYHVEGFGPFVPEGAELVQIVDDPAMAERAPEGLSIVGDVRAAVLALLDGPAPGPRAEPAPRAPHADPDPSRLTDALLIARLEALRPKGIAITEEAPSTRGPLHDYFRVHGDEEFHACASGGLGHALPAAVGVALGRPDTTVLCLLGDGSAMYSIQALYTAAQLALDIKFIVVNNGGYAALEQFGSLFGIEVVGSKLPALDFVKIAEGQGVPGTRIASAGELDAAITALFDATGPRLLEVVVQPG
jgi:benzoylformate decarboxylase